MLMLKIAGSHFAALGVGVFRHFVFTDPYELIKNLSRSADDWQEVSLADLPALLYTYGCDPNCWTVKDGGLVIHDPLRATLGPGNMWSASSALRAAVAGLTQPVVDPTPIVEAVREAIAAATPGAEVDEMAIAVAVNDLADQRERDRLGIR